MKRLLLFTALACLLAGCAPAAHRTNASQRSATAAASTSLSNSVPAGMVDLSGEVPRPGRYPFREGLTLGALLTEAGGLTSPFCNRVRIWHRNATTLFFKIRRDDKGNITLVERSPSTTNQVTTTMDKVLLREGDSVIFVPLFL